MNELRSQRLAAASSLEMLGDRELSLERQIQEQKRQIAEQQEIVKSAPPDARAGSSYGVLLVKKAELEAQLKDYSAQYTDKNPKVQQTQSQLAQINSNITQLGGGQNAFAATSSEARELRSLQRELAKMETELEITKRGIDRKKSGLPGGPASIPPAAMAGSPGAAGVEHETDVERLRHRHETLLKRHDELRGKIATGGGLDSGLFQVVDEPAEPRLPAGPNRSKLHLIALLIALGFGLAVVAAVETPRLFQVRDERDVEYYLGVPVLALIPETTTPLEEARSRRLALTRRFAVLALTAVLAPALMVLLSQSRLFQLLADRL
jgi:hypothetical protein